MSIPGLPPNVTSIEDYCTLDLCPLSKYGNFDYLPTLGGNAAYAGFFVLILALHAILGFGYRTWGFLVGMAVGLILEVVGYWSRTQVYYFPFAFNPFLIQLICLTLAPAFMCASIYLTLGRIVVVYGRSLSWLKPRTYTYIFVSCDLVSLVLQGGGGGITASADSDDPDTMDVGVNIMIAGLVFQVVALAAFMLLCFFFAWQVRKHPGRRNGDFVGLTKTFVFRAFLGAMGLSVVLIFVRCGYRVAELSGGFGGPLANDELLFMLLEGPVLMAACLLLAVFHPGVAFMGRFQEADPREVKSGSGKGKGKGMGMWRIIGGGKGGRKGGAAYGDDGDAGSNSSDVELATGPEMPIAHNRERDF